MLPVGFLAQIEALMAVNPGLKSRFSTRLHFPDFSPEDAAQLLVLTLQREYSLELGPEAEGALMGLAQQVRWVADGVPRIVRGAMPAYWCRLHDVPGALTRVDVIHSLALDCLDSTKVESAYRYADPLHGA